MDTRRQSIGRVMLQAIGVGLAVGLLYAVLFHLRGPLCAPSAEGCAIDRLGPLFAIPLGGDSRALWVLARRLHRCVCPACGLFPVKGNPSPVPAVDRGEGVAVRAGTATPP